jgi:hypothetical protein
MHNLGEQPARRTKTFARVGALIVALPCAAHAQDYAVLQETRDIQAQATIAPLQATDASRAPTLTVERYREDWSVLADPANRTGRWTEPFKYIPLDPSGHSYLTTGVEVRERYEGYDGYNWGSSRDQHYLWSRVMPYADLHVGNVRFFAQPILAYATGVKPGPSPIDQTAADLLQGFVDVVENFGPETSLRIEVGRQMFSFGSERLVGTRYGLNVPLAFDGSRANLYYHRGRLQIFYARPVENRLGNFDDRSSHQQALWGIYDTQWFNGRQTIGADFYYLGFRDRSAVVQQGSGREVRSTFGTRWFGASGGWHWNFEGAYQTGNFAGGRIHAWGFANEFGHIFPNLPLRPDTDLRVDFISGDKDPSKRDMQGFDPLFPKGKYFGGLSPIGPRNIIDVHPEIDLNLTKTIQLGLAGMAYWRQSLGDGVYDTPGRLLRAGLPSQARYIGKQAEVALTWNATRELTLSGSFAAFLPGAFIRETGSDRMIRMVGLETNFRF